MSSSKSMSEMGVQQLVLVPGLNNTHAVFDAVEAALPSRVCVHALDNPPLETVEAIAAAHLDTLPDRFWLAGFSFGGYVALAMLEMAPERVEGIALLCTSPFSDSDAASKKRLAALDAVSQGRYFEMVASQVESAFHPDSLANAELMGRRQAMVKDYGPSTYAAHVRATAARKDRSHLLDGKRPTLILGGADDKLFSRDVLAAYAAKIPGAALKIIERAGHLVPMEQPQAVGDALVSWMDCVQR